MMDSQATVLADRVRDLVRQRRIDPRLDTESVRRAAIEAIAEHESRSLTGAVRPLEEPEVLVGQILADVSGLGPLHALLDDDTVEEVWINDPSRVFVARQGRHELTSVILTAEQVRELVERMLSSSGRRLDISQPFVDAMLPGGHRLHVVLDGISRGFAAVNIRKFVATADSLTDLVTLGTIDGPAATFLDASVRAGLNIVVSGGTQAGKTTLLNCLRGVDPRQPTAHLGRRGLRAAVRSS
ncbi:ATPase, T2SS/T4P/T4SS family [Aeromicrobium sp. UC242_57]|uniref:ATPase, T2SS/T4P/T4SS family n=1 Tax=Aeromicrobium sp. UC242_57 TaxID=3374624 RepID=UPI0037938852